MKLPFVSRELYEQAKHEAESWQREYHVLQRALLAPPVQIKTSAPVPIVKPDPSILAETIKAESNGNARLAGYFWKRAKELRRDGKSDGDIADELSKWQTTEENESFV